MDDSASSSATYTAAAQAATEKPLTGDLPLDDATDAAISRVQAILLSLFRHLLTFVAGGAAWLTVHGLTPKGDASLLQAGEIIASLLAVIVARLVIQWLGKAQPWLIQVLANGLGPSKASAFLLAACILTAETLLLPSCGLNASSLNGVTGSISYGADGHPLIDLGVPLRDSQGRIIGTATLPAATGASPGSESCLARPEEPSPPERPLPHRRRPRSLRPPPSNAFQGPARGKGQLPVKPRGITPTALPESLHLPSTHPSANRPSAADTAGGHLSSTMSVTPFYELREGHWVLIPTFSVAVSTCCSCGGRNVAVALDFLGWSFGLVFGPDH